MLGARPIIFALAVVSIVVSGLADPDSIADHSAIILVATLLSIVASVAVLRTGRVQAAVLLAIICDAIVLVVAIALAPQPESASALLLWPILAIAYFGGWRWSGVATLVALSITVVFSRALPEWHDERPLPMVSFAILICGTIVAFMMRQVRMLERELSHAYRTDRVALEIARSITYAEGLEHAIRQIAEEVGRATGVELTTVALYGEAAPEGERNSASWVSTRGAREDRARALEPPLDRIVRSGLGIVFGIDDTDRTLSLVDGRLRVLAADPERAPALAGILQRTRCRRGVIVPLGMPGSFMGVLFLATNDPMLMRDALELLPKVTPQLATGMTQQLVVQQQRATLETLERLDRMRDRLIASVSHELRTPLTSTLGFLETLLRDDLELEPEVRHELLEHARDGARRLLALVEDLLTLGTLRPESLELAPAPVSAYDLIADALRGMDVITDRPIVLDIEESLDLLVDRNRMLQVVANLAINAVRHGSGRVEIIARRVDGEAMIDVLDEGPGVPLGHENELFVPFSSFSTRPDSTGLGLAICRTIVEAHGGHIRYARVEGGRRTRFRVCIPAAPERDAPADDRAAVEAG